MQRRTRRRRPIADVTVTAARGFIAFTVAATSVMALTAGQTAAAASAAPTIVTTAKAEAPAAAGGLALVSVLVRNTGLAATSTPVTMTLTLPTGVTVQSAEGLPGTKWQCSAAAPGASCLLQSSADSSAVALAGEDLTVAGLTLSLAPTVSVGAGLPIGIEISAPAGAGTPPDLTQASTSVTVTPLGTGVKTAITVTDDIAFLAAGRPTSVTTTIRNLGPGTLGGSGSNIRATGIIPPGSTAWTATGTGWTCANAGGLPSCTWTGSSVAKGATVPALTISFTAPKTPTAADAALEWTRTITATPTGGGTATVVTSALDTGVAAPVPPEVSLEARLTAPLGSVEAPATATVELRTLGQNMVDPGKTVSVALTIPAGFAYQSRSSTDAWTCATARSVLTCSRSADFAGAVVSTLTVTLGIAANAAVGAIPLSFTATVPGEPAAALTDNTAVTQVQIGPRPTSATTVRLWNYAGTMANPYDGHAVALVAGRATVLGIDAANTGNAPIAASTNFTLTLDLPKGTTTSTATEAGTPAWTCSTTTLTDLSRLTCTIRTSGVIAIDGALPRLKATLTAPNSAVDGPTNLALALTSPSAPALAATATVSAEVSHQAPAAALLGVSADLTTAPRAGGRAGTFTTTIRNTGNFASPGAATTVSLPVGLTPVLPLPTGCIQVPKSLGINVACTTTAPIAAGATTPPLVLNVKASAAAINPSVITVSAVPYSLPITPVTTTLSLPILPPLSAVGTATPSTITNVPADQPQPVVVLDGTASTAIDATSTWKQVPQSGEPTVVFTAGGDGRTASFAAPAVTASKTLHFVLTVTDVATTATAAVNVVVQPLPVVPPGGETGWETTEPAAPAASSLRLAAAGTPDALPAAPAAGPIVALAQNVTPPSISGSPFVGGGLTADPGTYDQEITSFAYVWLRCDYTAPTTCAAIPGATTGAYTTTTNDQTANGSVIRVEVTATPAVDAPITLRSDPTEPVSANEPRNITPPSIVVPGGGVRVGAVLQVQAGTWSRFPTISATEYQWSCSGGGAGCPGGPIAGATGSSYTLTADELGGTIRVTETARFSDTGASADSAPVGPVLTGDGGGGTPSAVLCRILTAVTAQGTGAVDISLANPHIRLNFANATVTSNTCTTDVVIDITGASIELFDWMRIEGVNVHITNSVVDMTGGTLTVPGDATLSAMNFRVISDGLHIPLDAAGGEINVAGRVIADSLPFLRLPGAWQAGAQIGMSSSGGVQQLSFDAIAWDSAAGAATTSPDALPVPPTNAARLALHGSMATNTTFSFALSSSALVKFADSGLDFAGTISRATPGAATVITASAQLAGPVTLASGVVLEAAALAWDGSTFTGSGTLGVTTNGGRLAISTGFSFTDASAWSATLSVTGAGTWTPASGITITNPTVSGTISRSGTTTNLAITIGAASIGFGPADGTPTRPVTLSNVLLTMNANCVTGTPCRPAFTAAGGVRVAVGSLAPITSTISGSLDTATGAFSITAALGAVSPFNGLILNASTLTISGGNGQPRAVAFTGGVTVLSLAVNATVTVDEPGTFVRVDLGNWSPGTGAPTFRGASIVYATYAAQTVVGTTTLDLVPRTVYIVGATSAPKWLSDLLKTTVGEMVVQGEINLATRDFDVRISIDLPSNPALFSVSAGKVTLRVSKVSLGVKMTGGSILTTLSSNATITMPNSNGGGTPTALSVTLAAAFVPTTGSLTGSVTFNSDWTNAFGIAGLTIKTPAMSISLGTAISVGFSGGVVLPTDWSNLIGLKAGTPINLVAALGTTGGCFGINIGTPGSTTTVLDMLNAGALTASYLSFEIAPTGCVVGAKTIPPGVSLVFDGKVLGAPLAVNASLTPGTPLSFTLDATIGSITASGFRLDGAHLLINYTPVTKAVSFSASGNVFGVNVAVSGAFAKTLTGTKAELTGQISAPNFGGFELNNFQVKLVLEQTAAAKTINASAALQVTILGAPQSVSFTFAAVNGVITEATADASINIPINGLTITGTGHFRFVQGRFPEITLAGSATVDGRSLTTIKGTLTRGGLTFSATVNLPSGTFASTPTVSGAIAWKSDGTSTIQIANRAGTLVTAQPGDFRFDATNLGLKASGFAMNANLTIGKVSGTFWAEIATDLTLGVPGNGGSIKVVGSFASNGDFTLNGTAALTIANAQLPSGTFRVVRAGTTLTVSGDITFAVPKLTTVRFQGTFSRSATTGTTFDLTGTGTVAPGGYNFGSGTFHLYRSGTGETALSVQITVAIPGLASGTAFLVVNGQDLEFVFYASMNGRIGAVLGSPTAGIWYQNKGATQSLSFYVEARDVLGIKGQVIVYGSINSANSYTFSVAATAGPWSGSRDLGVCRARYSAEGSFSGSITGTRDSLAISFTGNIKASARCGTTINVGAGVSFSYTAPTRVSMSVKVSLNFGVTSWNPTVFSFSQG